MLNKLIILLTAVSFFIGCQGSLEKEVQGNWYLENYYGDFNLINNYFFIKNDYTCDLPLSNIKDRYSDQATGRWEVFSSKGKDFIKIKSANKNFNDTYKIVDLDKVQDPITLGYYKKMTLVGSKDSTVLYCTKAL